MPPRRGGGGRESGERRPRRGDSLRRESSGARRSPRPRRPPSYDEATASDDDGYAESLSEASERVMKQLGAAQAAFCAAPAPQPQLLPSPSVLYDKLSTQATAIYEDAAHNFTRALSVAASGALPSPTATQRSTFSFARPRNDSPPQREYAAPPAPPPPRGDDSLPPVVRMRFPPGSLRVARGLSEEEDEYALPQRASPSALPVQSGQQQQPGTGRSGRSGRSNAFSRPRAAASGSERSDADLSSSSGGSQEKRRKPRAKRRAAQQRSRAAAADSAFGDASGAGKDAASAPALAPSRSLAAAMRARSAQQAGSVRASARSPHAQALKRHSDDGRGFFFATCARVIEAALASLLTLWTPIRSCAASPAPGTRSIADAASLNMCTLRSELQFASLTGLRQAAFVFNWATLGAFFLAECVFAWRELWLLEHCDEDREQPWAALGAQLAAYPSLARRLDRVNAAASWAARLLLTLTAANLALTAALAAKTQEAVQYRTYVVLVALTWPAAMRVFGAAITAGRAHSERLALPLWAGGVLSLNCLDEAFARTGEERV